MDSVPAVDADVVIVGGSVAGAASACAFSGLGLRVLVFEPRRLARDPNRGDLLHPPAIAHLRRWQALDELERRGAFFLRETVITDGHGRLHVRVPQGRHPMLVLAHAEIELSLLETATRQGAQLRAEAVRELRRDHDGWLVGTDAGVARARLLVGADGAGSLVRRVLQIPVGRREFAEAAVILHAPHPAWLDPFAYHLVLHPKGPVILLPTTPPGRCRVVVTVSATEAGEWMAADDMELRRRLGWRGSRLGGLALQRQGGAHLYRLVEQHAARYAMDGAALVGDAAHVTHPGGGQGMSLAIEDAAALADHAGRVVQRREPQRALGQALAAYEQQRRPINTRALRAARQAARFARPGRSRYLVLRGALLALSKAPGGYRMLTARFGGA